MWQPSAAQHWHRPPLVYQFQLIWRMTVSLRGAPRFPHRKIYTLVLRNVLYALLIWTNRRQLYFYRSSLNNFGKKSLFLSFDVYSWFSLFVVVIFLPSNPISAFAYKESNLTHWWILTFKKGIIMILHSENRRKHSQSYYVASITWCQNLTKTL